jgi:predicted TIM-barrel fold metal-dependent hydrolase
MNTLHVKAPNKDEKKVVSMIIDTHTHLGYDYVFEGDFTTERLLIGMKQNKIDASIVQPGITLDIKTVIKQHNAIADLAKKMPGRIYGMTNPSPHLPTTEYRKEVKRCVNELDFVSVKLHPLGHSVNPSSSAGKKVFQTALDLGIPVMVHTGAGIPWALPSGLIPIAMKYTKLNIVLAHSGSSIFSGEAALAAELCPNIYLETSWLPSVTVYNFCKTLGADRIMFGSDHGENVATELNKYRSIGLKDEELEWCLGKTAAKVFRIPVR